MGWGRRWGGGYGGGGGYGYGKKATASSLSASTLQRILAEKAYADQCAIDRHRALVQSNAERERKAAEELRLEEQHGGKEGLAAWRKEHAAEIAETARKAAEAAVKARAAAAEKAAEKAAVDAIAELREELAVLEQSGIGCAPARGDPASADDIELNKAAVKAKFHLTDRELEGLPKTVNMKEGAKRASSITWNGAAIFGAVLAKEGKKRLREYQRAAYPVLARKFIRDELETLEARSPALVESARKETLVRLHAGEQAAAASAAAARRAIELGQRQLDAALRKQADYRESIGGVATRSELEAFEFAPLYGDEGASSSTTPFTAAAGAPDAKKPRLGNGKASMTVPAMGTFVD